MEDRRILYNAIKTPDGTILHSVHRHDCVSHIDKNGNRYMNDGGNEYLRRGFDVKDYEDISVYDDGTHETRVKYLRWGSNYDKDMNRLSETIYKTIENMDTDHIEAVLNGAYCHSKYYNDIFEQELINRKNDKQ